MKRSRFSEEQIIAVLKEQESGMATADVCRRHGISSATFYKWKAKYGGLKVSDALPSRPDSNRTWKRILGLRPQPGRTGDPAGRARRKNHLFAGSDGGGARWATVCSLIKTCRLNDVEPYAYLRDVLQTMIDGHPVNRLDEVLPWAWKAQNHVNP